MKPKSAGVAASLCAILALGGLARADEAADVRAGRELFERHCVLCHGPLGRGDGPLADDLRVAPADLTGIATRRAGTFPDVEISEIIDGRRPVRGHGAKEMPIWGRAFGADIADKAAREAAIRDKVQKLLAYLRSIQVAPQHTVGQR